MTTKNVSQERQGLLWPLCHVVAGREPADLYGSRGQTVRTISKSNHRVYTFAVRLNYAQSLCSLLFTDVNCVHPDKGLICYGSEQAAVKAGMNYEFRAESRYSGQSRGDLDDNALRLDLMIEDEIIVLDWGKQWYKKFVSKPNRSLRGYEW
jgi:hypothetical protein